MTFIRSLRLSLRRYGKDEDGAMVVEGLIAATFLIWWYMASFQYFDAFKQKNTALKAAYTLADMVSRETGPTNEDPNAVEIDQAYVNGLNRMFDYLTFSNRPTWIRITSVYWNATDNRYHVDWSATSGTGHESMTTPMLQQVANRIPVLPNGDSIILVETFLDYQPIMPIGLNQTVLQTFITTAPRFSSCVPWQDYGCGTDNQGRWVRPDLTDVPDPDTDLGDTT